MKLDQEVYIFSNQCIIRSRRLITTTALQTTGSGNLPPKLESKSRDHLSFIVKQESPSRPVGPSRPTFPQMIYFIIYACAYLQYVESMLTCMRECVFMYICVYVYGDLFCPWYLAYLFNCFVMDCMHSGMYIDVLLFPVNLLTKFWIQTLELIKCVSIFYH